MSRTTLLFALLGLLAEVPAVVAGPPEGPSSRMVQDPVPALRAEVRRLEKEVARGGGPAEDLAVARARLAAAEGRTADARAAWRKILDARTERVIAWEALVRGGRICTADAPALMRGPVAEARCELAEVEGDRAALARELPKVIAYHEAQLAQLRRLADARACSPEDVEQGEKTLQKELRQVEHRLDAVKRR
jgi:hypothetical protein